MIILGMASEQEWSVNAYTEGVSRYLWRGQNLHDNFAMQPGLELCIGNGAIGVWGSYNLVEEETKGLAEVDYYTSYSMPLPFLKLCEATAGFFIYTYPSLFGTYNEEFSVEGVFGMAVDVPASPALTYYFDAKYGQYVELEVSHEHAFGECFTVAPKATAGYGMVQDPATAEWSGNPSVLALMASATYSTAVDITAKVAGQVPLQEDYEADLFFGLGISYTLSVTSK
jgi:hypothetical protein